jgi:RNA polymerase sigma factor (TIGR02999 family)
VGDETQDERDITGADGILGRQDLDDLFSTAYAELRRIAGSLRRRDRMATVSPTTLVNQAWIKLASSRPFRSMSPLHFKRIAARAMRQILVESARRRRATKRGGGAASFITLDESLIDHAVIQDVLALDTALDELARLHPRQAQMVECRFFGGLEVAEIAALQDTSEATVLRDWRAAKAWLARELRGSSSSE